MIALTLLIAASQNRGEAVVMLNNLRLAAAGGTPAKVQELFLRKEDSEGLMQMAQSRGGFRNLRVAVIPAPNGWGKGVRYWAIFHARQNIQSHTDKLFAVSMTENGPRLGKEIPYIFDGPYRIAHQKFDVRLKPAENRIEVATDVDLRRAEGDQSIIFSLGDPYTVSLAKLEGKTLDVLVVDDATVPSPTDGTLVRAGSLLVLWGPPPTAQNLRLRFEYSGIVNSTSEDKIAPNVAYVTAWWAPSIAQLPFTTETTIVAPDDWVVRSEGLPVGKNAFRCDLPIAFPKIIGGKYLLAGERKDGDKTFRAWHLGAVDKARAERDIDKMIRGCRFFEQHLGPFPFPGYEVFDADSYYGIESYSHTLLNYRFTTRFVTHEMGHTYFGGMAPSAYLKDSWNEGLTQWIDSVVLDGNADRTLENGLRTLDVKVPLSRMAIPHANSNATYMRGAYVMRMLENEIGQDEVMEGLRAMLKDRVGKETLWGDLRAYFEKSSGKNLDWFWAQWIDGAVFPTLEIAKTEVISRDGKFTTLVTVIQKGTEDYRLRFKVRLTGATGQKAEQVVVLGSRYQEFQVDSDFKPVEAQLDVFGYCLATVAPGRKL